MQGFTKKLTIAFLTLFLGVAIISCGGETTTEPIIPKLSNGDSVFLANDDYTLTYNDVYNEVKINDGLNQLLNMVDNDLLNTYVTAVSNSEIAERIKVLKYGTSEAEEIADLTEEQLAEAEIGFANSMHLLGYTEQALIEDYVRLVVARENYVVEQMLSEDNAEEAWYSGPSAVADWYDSKYKPEMTSIKIRFMSEADAKTVLRSFNLVSKSGELRLYTGTTPLEQVPSSQIDETNSRLLSDEETLTEFIKIYNYIYSDIKDEVDENASVEDLKALEDLQLDYDLVAEANAALASFMFETLGDYETYTEDNETTLYYSYEPLKYYGSNDTSYYMLLNISKEDKVDVEDFDGTEAELVALIGQDLYDELQQEIIDLYLTQDSFVSSRLITLRSENSFTIYDYYLAKDYSNIDNEFEINEEGHETNLASYGSETITADQLFIYATGYNLPMYTIYALQTKAIAASHYEDIYCPFDEENPDAECEWDVTLNTSEKMEEHRTTLASLEEQFNSSYYAGYYEFDEYLYLAYGVKSDAEMLYKYYVKTALQPLFIYDEIIKDDYQIIQDLMDLYQPYVDNYFSLNVEHVLIYVDRDENANPDDYEDFYNDLDAAQQATYDAKLLAFQAAIETYLDDEEKTMPSLVGDYTKATRDDETWGEFKAYGFHLLTETLGELNYAQSVDQFEKPFESKLIELYQEYNTPELENEEYLLDDEYTQTKYGLHLIKVKKGTAFDQPSAKFTMTYDEDGEPEYLAGLVNDSDELTLEQLKIYADYRFTVLAYGTGDFEEIYGLGEIEIPSSLLTTLETYFQNINDATYVVGVINNIIINNMPSYTWTADSQYISVSQAEFINQCDIIADILMYQVYEPYDHRNLD